MKFSGSELAAQRTAQRKYRALYNYGDLIAYRAFKYFNAKSAQLTDQPAARSAYYGACVLQDSKSTPGTSLIVKFGGMSESRCAINVTTLDESDENPPPCDPTVIDPQFASNTAEVWQFSSQGRGHSVSLEFINEFVLPINLVGHSMVPYRAKNKIIIYGGAQLGNRSLFSNIFVLSVKTSEVKQLKVHKAQPSGRLRHSAYLVDDKMYIHGGQCHSSSAVYLEDLWCLDLLKYEWTQLKNKVCSTEGTANRRIETQADYEMSHGPGRRFGHHMAIYKGTLYVAFGSDGATSMNDVWAYSLANQFWYRLQLLDHRGDPYPTLTGRSDCAASFDEGTGKWLFHGGINRDGELLSTVLEINLNTHECRRVQVEVANPGDGRVITHCSSTSSSSTSFRCVLPSLRGHSFVHIPDSPYDVLMRGIDKKNRYTLNDYVIMSTGKSEMKLRLSKPRAEPVVFDSHVTPIFDTTHTWQTNLQGQKKNMPDQPPTLTQSDLIAVDSKEPSSIIASKPPVRVEKPPVRAIGESPRSYQSEVPSRRGTLSSRFCESEVSMPVDRDVQLSGTSTTESEMVEAPKRVSLPPRTEEATNPKTQHGRPGGGLVGMRESAGGSQRIDKTVVGKKPSLPDERMTCHGSPAQSECVGISVESSFADSPAASREAASSGATDYWRKRCLVAEQENKILRHRLKEAKRRVSDQQHATTAAVRLLLPFSASDIDQ